MTQEAMKKRLYELYQLKWMMTHGKCIKDIIRGMFTDNIDHEEYMFDDEYGCCMDIERMYDTWEHDVGFNDGEKWNSFKEFCRAEMSDIGYIKSLLDIVPSEEGLRDAYNKWLDDNNMEATVA